MHQSPKDRSKIRARVRRYERELRKEKQLHGFIDDGGGKRHRLGILYMLLEDNDGMFVNAKVPRMMTGKGTIFPP